MNRRGWTTTELMVALGIAGLLLSIVLPGVLMARASARRQECANKLRQIGLALTQYEATNKAFPRCAWTFVTLLPYLGEEALFRHVDFTKDLRGAVANVEYVPVAKFRCPSDPWDKPPCTNYAICGGSGHAIGGEDGLFRTTHRYPNRPLPSSRAVTVAEVRDGLSHTAAVCEILPGGIPSDKELARLRGTWRTPEFFDLAGGEIDPFIDRCLGVPDFPGRYGWQTYERGNVWSKNHYGNARYNHTLTPNLPSCINNSSIPDGIFTAASLHSGGVNLVMADGRLTFVSNSVDRAVWRAVSTIAGGEPLSFPY